MFRETFRLRFCHGLETLTLAMLCSGILLSPAACGEPVDFSRDIQPLLATRCFP
jgi:hypothetical protein